jgi:hypothetical protein
MKKEFGLNLAAGMMLCGLVWSIFCPGFLWLAGAGAIVALANL